MPKINSSYVKICESSQKVLAQNFSIVTRAVVSMMCALKSRVMSVVCTWGLSPLSPQVHTTTDIPRDLRTNIMDKSVQISI
jgi:hypothetical protein